MKQYLLTLIITVVVCLMSACSRQESATNNDKITQAKSQSSEDSTVSSNNEGENMADILQSFDPTEEQNTSSQDASSQDVGSQDLSQTATTDTANSGVVSNSTLEYNCDIEADRQTLDPDNIDIVVGDNYYSTQINDWYINFDEYEGKTVEIEGYYIADYLPYLFVGRFGPTCPYCQGAYVCFEFYTKQDLSELVSGKDWIKVKGILRQDEDESGQFYYIEVMYIDKMDEVGQDTITN
ncbi:MAG: hypothetical protein ACERKZ_11410 [Lachnotalea sp.]